MFYRTWPLALSRGSGRRKLSASIGRRSILTPDIEIKKSKAKTKGRRLIKMQPNLVEWLKKARQTSGPVTRLVRPEKTASEVVGAKLEPAIAWKRNGLRHSYC